MKIWKNIFLKSVTICSLVSLLSPVILPSIVVAEANVSSEESSSSEEVEDINEVDSDDTFINEGKETINSDDSSFFESEASKEAELSTSEETTTTETENQEIIDSPQLETSEFQNFSQKNAIPVYDEILSSKYIHNDAIVIEGTHDLYTEPGYTEGSEAFGKSTQYLNQRVRVVQEKVTNRATWAQIWVNGKTIGWMNKKGLKYIYDIIQTMVTTKYEATVIENFHDIYTTPGYTENNEIIGKSVTYLNQTVQVLEEKKTDRATWVLVSQNNKIIGWMNKSGLTIQTTTVISSKQIHYEAKVSQSNKQIFSDPGYTVGATAINETTNFIGQIVRVTEQKETNLAKWFLISKDGKDIGWVEQNDVTIQYDEVINTKNVHYDGTIVEDYHDIYSVPGYTEGNEILSKSYSYLNKKVRIIQEIETERATWVQVSIDGKPLGWINKIGLKIQTDAILSTKVLGYYAIVQQDWHNIYTVPGYTKGNEIIGNSATYLNQEVKVVQEKVTNRAVWAQIEIGNKIVGWMNKMGLDPKLDTILSAKPLHYEAFLTAQGKMIYTAPGNTKDAEVIGSTSDYLNKTVKITEQKTTNRAIWFKTALTNGKELGWIDQKDLTVKYDNVSESRLVHNDAIVIEDFHDIYTVPGYTEDNGIIANSAKYLNKKVRIVQEKVTNRAIWAKISIDGKVIGWMNKKGLKLQYDTITSTKTVDIDAKIIAGWHDIYTIPGYTPDNKIIDKSSSYMNEDVKIVQEKVAKNRATWALVEKNGKTIGWLNKDALKVIKVNYSDVVTSSKLFHYEAVLNKGDKIIYSAPGFTSGAKEVGNTNSYLDKLVKITQEKVTDRAIWAEISLDGTIIGWVDKESLVIKYDQIVSSKLLHYEGTITEDYHDIYTVPGYTQGNEITAHSWSYLNRKVRILEEKTTKRATWVLISIDGKTLGWMNKMGITIQYDKALNSKSIHHNANVSEGYHDVYTVPGYTEGNQILTKSATYLNQKVKIVHTMQTDHANWAQFSINDKIIGWMNITGLSIIYDTVTSTKTTNFNAKVSEKNHDIYTNPGYTSGNEIIGKSDSYLNQSVKVLQEKVTNRATWALIAVNGKTIGWMNKKGLNSMLVYLDPGHGGDEPGAIAGGIKEKDINLKVALKIEKLLVANGYEVIISRRTDKFVSLSNRAQEANKAKADIFVSVHHNSFLGTSYGIETYSYNRLGNSTNPMSNNTNRSLASGQLSSAIHKALIRNTGAYDRGTRTANFHVIRETNMPAVLLELGYMDYASERAKLVTDSYQKKLAQGAYEGIVQYFK